MYKTIRHGENSLQYTILPQNDDFRIEGKLSSAGSSCTSGRSVRKTKVKRPKRRSFFAYLGLIFVCTVIVGAVLIPFLVSAECLPSPTEWFLKTKAALTKSTNGNAGSGGSIEAKEKINNVNSDGNGRNMLGNGINVGKTVKIINKDGVEKIIVRVNTTEGNGDESVKVAAEIVNENKVYLPDVRDQPMENTSNTSISNRTNQNVEALTSGNAAMIANDQMKETEAEMQQSGSETMISENEIDYEKSDFIPSNPNNNNNEPITQPENENVNVVSEVRFDTAAQNPRDNRLLSVIAPTILVTTLRNTQNNNNNNNYNTKSINEAAAKPFVATAQSAPNIRPTLPFSASNVNSPRAPSNPNQNQLAINSNNYSAMPTIVTRIIQVPLLKSAAKKPIIPPVLVKTNSELSATTTNNNNNNVLTNNAPTTSNGYNGNGAPENSIAEQQPKNSNWIHSHWPYIDPSTYFQWTGYKAEDSVLLPALLGFALIGMILIITVCLVARNKRTIVSSVRKRNRNDIEETGAEDNATLLTTNLSDED